MGGVSSLANAGAQDVLSGVFESSVAEGGTVSSLASAGSAGISVGIKLLSNVIASQGLEGVESLEDIMYSIKK